MPTLPPLCDTTPGRRILTLVHSPLLTVTRDDSPTLAAPGDPIGFYSTHVTGRLAVSTPTTISPRHLAALRDAEPELLALYLQSPASALARVRRILGGQPGSDDVSVGLCVELRAPR